MKNLVKEIISVIFIMNIPFASVLSQNCDWNIRNRTDCDISVAIYQDCNGTVTVGNSKLIRNGTWSSYSQDTLFNQPCDTSCTIKLRISNVNNPAAEYAHGDYFCCYGSLVDCIPNDCVLIGIDYVNKRIQLFKPPQCP